MSNLEKLFTADKEVAAAFNTIKPILDRGEDLVQFYEDKVREAIVPDIVDEKDIDWNSIGLVVKFPNVSTLLGNELTPHETRLEPIIHYHSEKDQLYTILMTDPDAPCREYPELREIEHWLVGNIPGQDLHLGDFRTEYIGPGPPKGTGLHRYIFLLFKQPAGRIEFTEPYKPVEERASRRKFNTREFMKKYNFTKVVGANFFQSEWSET